MKDGLGITLRVDVGKPSLLAVCRWAERFERQHHLRTVGEVHQLKPIPSPDRLDRNDLSNR